MCWLCRLSWLSSFLVTDQPWVPTILCASLAPHAASAFAARLFDTGLAASLTSALINSVFSALAFFGVFC